MTTASIIVALALLLEPAFNHGYRSAKVADAQVNVGALSTVADRFWRACALGLISELETTRTQQAERVARLLPPSDRPEEVSNEELSTSGAYGKLPDVYADRGHPYLFPVPISPPIRHSWYQLTLAAAQAWRVARSLEKTSDKETSRLARGLDDLQTRLLRLTANTRHLETWQPPLQNQWQELQARRAGLKAGDATMPIPYRLVQAIARADARAWSLLKEPLKPRRILVHPYLPKQARGEIVLPIATDVADGRFRREIEDALSVYWNRSPWARANQVSFKVRWTDVPKWAPENGATFRLETHLASFPKDQASMTTGGLTTMVSDRTLILGPGRVDQRTLGHELGHLLGFNDCYLRTLSGQGPFGQAILEWDNPLYPDELMCDNTVGVARVGVW